MSYTINDIAYPSVTGILGQLEKPALIPWAANTAVDYCEMHKDEPDVFLKAKKEWREASKEAMDIGSEVHSIIEKYIKSGKDTVGELRPEVENGFLAFLEWESEHIEKWLESEQPVYSEEIGVAGTLDAIAVFKDGLTRVIDFKSSKGFYSGYGKQICIYRKMRLECNGKKAEIKSRFGEYSVEYPEIKIDGQCVVRLDKVTGEPEMKDYNDYDRRVETFELLTKVYYTDKNRRLKNNPIAKTLKERYK